jgi:HAMP domain-containing protein
LKEDLRTRNTGRKRGDTLDYYNDSLPKRAVESLFDKDDKLSSDGDLISGYNSDSDDDYDSMNDGYDGYGPSRRTGGGGQVLDGILSGTGSRSAVRERGSRGTDTDDSVDSHISLYSNNMEKRQRRDTADEDDRVPRITPASRADDRTSVRGARGVASSTTRGARGEERRISYPYGEPRAGERVPGRAEERIPGRSVPSYEEDRQNTRGSLPIRSEEMARRARAGADDSRRRPPYTAPGARGQSARLYDNADDEGDGALPLKNIVIAIAVFVVLIIFTFLIIQLNGANSRYAQAQSELELAKNDKAALTDLQIESDGYKSEAERLAQEVETLQQEIDALRGSNAPIDGEGPVALPPAPEGGNPPPGESGSTNAPQTYTVKAGDSLSKIAERFYGNNDYERIKEANGLTSDDLSIGKELIIP